MNAKNLIRCLWCIAEVNTPGWFDSKGCYYAVLAHEIPATITDGICPLCKAKMLTEIKKWVIEKEASK